MKNNEEKCKHQPKLCKFNELNKITVDGLGQFGDFDW